jgi:anti-sigma regulatory factor (Ser/Thr protein kinase)
MPHLSIPPRAAELRKVREWVRAWARTEGLGDDDLTLVATELVANAIDATPSDRDIEVVLRALDDDVELVVVDRGSGFAGGTAPSIPDRPPPLSQQRGRGLFMVGAVVDELHLARLGDRTVATARLARRVLVEEASGPAGRPCRTHRLRR